jgi:hypothetical protein
VLAPGYFAAASGMLRPGELIYVSVRPPAPPARGAAPGEAQTALVTVRAREPHCETADGSVRLVQDFGRPSDSAGMLAVAASASDGAAPPAPVNRGRGRPRGSRKKAAVSLVPSAPAAQLHAVRGAGHAFRAAARGDGGTATSLDKICYDR